jgi:hypothetical protein
VLSDIAVLVGVRMCRFEDEDIAVLQDPTIPLTQRRERALLPKLSPMTLAVPKCEMASLATREVASHLRLEERG